ncbi:hypothetical protein DFH05DRAFT_169134 [Lentinula detonsa]|uniref:Uncharacterized protein n=1 Tax=Lentinula detonsa TaxID=2804962 RepID=A0A9W8PCG1_9AGAR|nr:hypothetical protein DFH05DRAFT_169134 [Lentinula detonsa]
MSFYVAQKLVLSTLPLSDHLSRPFLLAFILWLIRLQPSEGLFRFINEEATEEDNQFETDDDCLPDNLLPFNMETLGSHFSYERVGMILHMFENEQLTTHGIEWQKTLEALSQQDRVYRKRQRK